MPEPLLALHDLRKSFGALAVTDGVSFTVMPGEIHALIGPNGAGKTSLIHQISGMLRPDSGRVVFAGVDLGTASQQLRVRRGLARSFQITSIVPGFSALENVALAVQARHGSSFRFFRPVRGDIALNRAALAALTTIGIAEHANRPAGALSHGQKRRLELAIAIATEPRLLLLDEPLAGAGAEETAQLVALLRLLRTRFAILLVEHDMQAVFALADRISVLVYGRLIATGNADAIRNNLEVRSAYLGEDELA